MKFDQDIVNILHVVNDLKAKGAQNIKILINIYTAGIMAEYITGGIDNISYKEIEPNIYYMGTVYGIDVYVNKANIDLKDYVEIDCEMYGKQPLKKIEKIDLYSKSKEK